MLDLLWSIIFYSSVLAAMAGFLYGPIGPLQNYAMQTRTPEDMRGRAFGVLTSAAYAAGPIGYLIVGPLVEGLGLRPAFLQLDADLLAQVDGQLGLRRRQGFVLADQAAQLLGHHHHAGFERGVGVERQGFLGLRHDGAGGEQRRQQRCVQRFEQPTAHGLTH